MQLLLYNLICLKKLNILNLFKIHMKHFYASKSNLPNCYIFDKRKQFRFVYQCLLVNKTFANKI